jgi:hypothetical protein
VVVEHFTIAQTTELQQRTIAFSNENAKTHLTLLIGFAIFPAASFFLLVPSRLRSHRPSWCNATYRSVDAKTTGQNFTPTRFQKLFALFTSDSLDVYSLILE